MPHHYYVCEYYDNYDDFTAQSKGTNSGSGGRNKGKTNGKSYNPDGKYSSKHIRISLEKQKVTK